MSDVTIQTPKYAADAALVKDEGFMRWITELEAVLRNWDAKHGADHQPYELPLVDSTGLECWHAYYVGDYSPEDAFAEDQTYWEAE